ncbi:MAG TPA: endopeptidase La [Candidatus Onthovicinus excrementipullorum]|nr:endopeptidase La [Candidatus Onthovicinus excrementipullorum]
MPCVALRGMVVFPGMLLHFDVGREKSAAAVKAAVEETQDIFLTAQKDVRIDDPARKDLYRIGTVCSVLQVVNISEGVYRVVVEGKYRASLSSIVMDKPFILAATTRCKEKGFPDSPEAGKALVRSARRIFDDYAAVSGNTANDIIVNILEMEEPGALADYIASNILADYKDKQHVLEIRDVTERLSEVCRLLARETELLRIENHIEQKVHQQMDDNQRDYYLREKLSAIAEELGDGENPCSEAETYRKKIKALSLPQKSEEKLLKDCDHLGHMSPGSQEGTVLRNYLDVCLELPWNKFSRDSLNIPAARRLLDREHSGMAKVKEQVLEYLAVRRLAPESNGQILCLAGPPGVGKTSIAASIAKAMGRKYVRISLGGVRDEADIRGHRKTYIGSMPGRIIDAIRQAGTSNPLILLDEVDKLGADMRGDPSSALLEVLDGEQNREFHDHYLEIPYDLSKVFFITTANDVSAIPAPLYDRMDIVELPSYTHEEKFTIAREHLIPKQIRLNGLTRTQLRITDAALHEVIDGYTREAGVRSLERRIATLCRRAAMAVVEGEKSLRVTPADLKELLGTRRFKEDLYSVSDEVGVANGLAWTSVGGVLMPIEIAVLDGKGDLKLTGSLGDVMKESAQAAVSVIRARWQELGIDRDFYKNKDIHIHAPEGAVPKDGPSAGVTMVTALVSALRGDPVRADIAMTGEITLRGRVFPIGGLREKSMAAYRAGIRDVIIPADNVPDLDDIDSAVKAQVRFHPVNKIEQVLRLALRPAADGEHAAEKQLPVERKHRTAGSVIAQ